MNLMQALNFANPVELATSLSAAQSFYAHTVTEERLAARAIDAALLTGDVLAERRARVVLAEAERERQKASAALDGILSRLGRLTAA